MGDQHKRLEGEERARMPSDDRYKYWIEYLKISPLYRRNYEIENGLRDPAGVVLSELEKNIIRDFGDVWKLGDVELKEFYLFGVELSQIDVKVIATLGSEDVVNEIRNLRNRTNTYINQTYSGMGDPRVMIVSIPIDLELEYIKRVVVGGVRYYRENLGESRERLNHQVPKYTTMRTGTTKSVLDKNLRIVRAAVDKPNAEDWRIAKALQISPRHASIIENRKSTIEECDKAREVLRQYIYRGKYQAKVISCNAALGVFPNSEELDGVEYNEEFDMEFLKTSWKNHEDDDSRELIE